MQDKNHDNAWFVFQLLDDYYAVPVRRVTHILELQKATRVPETPDYLEGIINVRGELIPLIDTKAKFGLPATELPDEACILIIDVFASQSDLRLGLVVDRAMDVKDIPPQKLESVPDLGLNLNPDYVKNVANLNDKVFLMLDIDKIFSSSEITSIKEISENKKTK